MGVFAAYALPGCAVPAIVWLVVLLCLYPLGVLWLGWVVISMRWFPPRV